MRPLLASLHTIIRVADWVHERVNYQGGRLAIAVLFEMVPGLLLVEVPASELPGLGAMERSAGCARIAVVRDLPGPVKRITIAHEIGHALLHEGHILNRRIGQTSPRDVRERQADLFAETLLAPAWAIARLEDQSARNVAATFDVPLEVARRRLRVMRTLRKIL